MSRKATAVLTSDDTSVKSSKERWVELFGSEPSYKKDDFLQRAIAWHEQVQAHGDVAPAIQRDLNIAAAQVAAGKGGAIATAVATPFSPASDSACSAAAGIQADTLPTASSQLVPGARLVKAYGGTNHVVEVIDDGFLYNQQTYRSLSAIAKAITGTHWNGLLFFGLRKRKVYDRKKNG
ncbi:MAG: DUF2924 domain-containing protein [Sphingomonas sp.]|uniref:DUF2924 domain-containing protein n=1 Tax=Sphingomonas sp. TaxID=28214 RepID=UPI003F7FDE81